MLTQELLLKIVVIQKAAARRGYQLINARGTKYKLYETPYNFEFSSDSVSMAFQENTRHDCPDYCSITLTLAELLMSEYDWEANIKQIMTETEAKKLKADQERQQEIINNKRRQFEALKAELEKL